MTMMVCPRCWGHKQPFCDKCQNKGLVADVRLSKNFMLSELVASRTAKAKRIANDPTVKQLDRLLATSRNLLQPVRDGVGRLNVTSGFRTPELNKAIGGAKNSAHVECYAADVQPQQMSLVEMMHWLWKHKNELEFDQVILEYGKRVETDIDDWIHLGWKHPSGQHRKQFLMKDAAGKWSNWTP